VSRECFIIAIDGPAGVGKSTTSRRVAEDLGLRYLDSGALYRAVGLAALEAGVDLNDAVALSRLASSLEIESSEQGRVVLLDGRDVSARIRTSEVSQAASRVSAHPQVREALIDLQRGAAKPPGTVAEGRDIGTVIFPHADLKIFLDADPQERARRRAAEMVAKAGSTEIDNVKREMAERDRRDSTRVVAPLEAAPDALIIDSTELGIDEVVEGIVKEARRRRARE
jgi:cytidylate kinase